MPDIRDSDVEKKIKEFGDLIDTQTARLLLEYERGQLSDERIEKLRAKLDKMVNSVEEGVILEVEQPRNYTKKNGTRGRLLGIKIGMAGGGEARLVFWDNQIGEVNLEAMKEGERIGITNCIHTDGRYGHTISTGKGGSIRLQNGQLLYPTMKK